MELQTKFFPIFVCPLKGIFPFEKVNKRSFVTFFFFFLNVTF